MDVQIYGDNIKVFKRVPFQSILREEYDDHGEDLEGCLVYKYKVKKDKLEFNKTN